MSQHNSNYSTTFIILIISKIFTWLNYTFQSIYSNTSPSTKHNLPNIFFKILGVLRVTYPFFSFTTTLTCQKNYISTWFKLLNYIYHFNCIKNIYLSQYILTPVNPLNTIYQIIYFNILWVCWLLVYTCKPLLYTKKIERKVLPLQCPAPVKYLISGLQLLFS